MASEQARADVRERRRDWIEPRRPRMRASPAPGVHRRDRRHHQDDPLARSHGSHSAIDHLQRSFEVRDPIDTLQYWIASRRSLGEALVEKSLCQPADEAARSQQQAPKTDSRAAPESGHSTARRR